MKSLPHEDSRESEAGEIRPMAGLLMPKMFTKKFVHPYIDKKDKFNNKTNHISNIPTSSII